MTTIDKNLNSTINVLLVDDNFDLATVTGMLLKKLRFHVQTCNTGKDCIMLAESSQPDIILLDLDMPVMNGYQVCQHIRKQIWGVELNIIAYTGRDSIPTRQHSEANGFDKFLSKPASYQELSLTITNIVSQSR